MDTNMESLENLSYEELMQRAEEIKRIAMTKVKKERGEKIKEINAIIKRYGIKRGELYFPDVQNPGGLGFRVEPGFYRNPETGEISEVRKSGRKPNWMYSKTQDEMIACRVESKER